LVPRGTLPAHAGGDDDDNDSDEDKVAHTNWQDEEL
jgi:hypothetical protein